MRGLMKMYERNIIDSKTMHELAAGINTVILYEGHGETIEEYRNIKEGSGYTPNCIDKDKELPKAPHGGTGECTYLTAEEAIKGTKTDLVLCALTAATQSLQ